MVVQDSPTTEDHSLLRMSQDLDYPRLQVANVEFEAIGGKQVALPTEATHRDFVQRDKSQLVNEPPRDDGPIGGAIQLCRNVSCLRASFSTT